MFDGPFISFLIKLGDMIVLHVLWLICSIPIITVGPATAAAHYVVLKLVRNEGASVTKMFFTAFTRNFRQGVILGSFSTIAGGLLGLDIYLCIYKLQAENISKLILLAALVFLSLIYLIVMLYVWAVLARFENTVRRILVNSFLLALGNWGDTSILLFQDIIILTAAFLSFVFLPQIAVLFAIFGTPLLFVVNAFRMRTVLDRCAGDIKLAKGEICNEQ